MSTINRPPIGINNDDEHSKALVKRQTKNDKNHDISRNYALISYSNRVFHSSSVRRWWTVDPWYSSIKGRP